MSVLTNRQRRLKRRRRVRARIQGTAERPRLSVYRSNKGVFAQLIDDSNGHTLAIMSLAANASFICHVGERAVPVIPIKGRVERPPLRIAGQAGAVDEE